MWRPRVGLLAIGLLVWAGGALAQQEVLQQLPFYEDQMAGVKLGWQARTITGLWNFNDVSFQQSARLRKVYRMPDQIIMRLGTKIPIFTGNGSGANGVYNFFLGTYGRGNTQGGAGGGGEGSVEGESSGAAEAMGPSDAEVRAKVRDFVAQAQGVAPPAMAPEPGGAPAGAGAPAGPEVGDLGIGDRAAEQGPYAGLPADQAEEMFNKLEDQAKDIFARILELEEQRRMLGAQINVPISEYDKIDQQEQRLIMQLFELVQEAMELAANSQTLAARGQGLGAFAGLNLYYHVFHIGRPNRDIVFCYRMDRDTWLSVTINFYTWQVDGITVANTRGRWAGARTSPAPDGTPGIALGDSLEQIFNRYGWPDGFESFYGKYLVVHYYDTNNVGFLLEHVAPKIWRVVRIMIEPRPNGKERQLGGVQLGLNAQQLLTIRRRGTNKLVYGQPHAVERPNHRISVVTSPPAAADWPPGVPLDPRVFGAFALGGGGGAAGGGPEGSSSEGESIEGGSSAPNVNIPSTGGNQVPSAPVTGGLPSGAMVSAPGVSSKSATDRYGRPTALAQSPPDAGLPGGAGGEGLGAAGEVEAAEQPDFGWVPYPMPWRYDWDAYNVEPLCGAEAAAAGTGGDSGAEGGSSSDAGGEPGAAAGGGGGGGGSASVSREELAAALSAIYADGTGQVGYNIVYGGRSNPADCHVNTLISESEYRWDYSFATRPRVEGNRLIAGDTKVEFGLDQDGLCTQIGVMGVEWGGARTKRGIALGSTLRDVFLRYGPPLLYNELTQDINEQAPNVHFASYARDELGRPRGNINLVLQDKYVTAMQIVQIGVQ